MYIYLTNYRVFRVLIKMFICFLELEQTLFIKLSLKEQRKLKKARKKTSCYIHSLSSSAQKTQKFWVTLSFDIKILSWVEFEFLHQPRKNSTRKYSENFEYFWVLEFRVEVCIALLPYFRITDIFSVFLHFILRRYTNLFSVLWKYGENVHNTKVQSLTLNLGRISPKKVNYNNKCL